MAERLLGRAIDAQPLITQQAGAPAERVGQNPVGPADAGAAASRARPGGRTSRPSSRPSQAKIAIIRARAAAVAWPLVAGIPTARQRRRSLARRGRPGHQEGQVVGSVILPRLGRVGGRIVSADAGVLASGRPIHRSRPKGSQISSRSARPRLRPSARRNSSPARWPKVRRDSPTRSPAAKAARPTARRAHSPASRTSIPGRTPRAGRTGPPGAKAPARPQAGLARLGRSSATAGRPAGRRPRLPRPTLQATSGRGRLGGGEHRGQGIAVEGRVRARSAWPPHRSTRSRPRCRRRTARRVRRSRRSKWAGRRPHRREPRRAQGAAIPRALSALRSHGQAARRCKM